MPDDRPKSRKLSQPRRLLFSIRARLIVLALIAIAPLMFERVKGLQDARAHRTERANAEVVDLAHRGAQAQRDIIYSVRALLQVIARVYATTPFNPAQCTRYLDDLTSNVPWVRALSVAGTNGQIICSTEHQAIGLNVSDRKHFEDALRLRDFALSDYFITQTRPMPSLIAAYPAIREDGTVAGVILGVVDLQWLSKLAAGVAQRPGTSVLLIDGSGTLVAAPNGRKDLVGKPVTRSALVRQMLVHDEGTITTEGLDGMRRVFGYGRVPWTQARLAVGIEESEIQSGINRQIGVATVQLAFIGIFVLLVTWFGGEQLIVRPIRSMARMVSRFGRGELSVRASQQRWLTEFEPLATAFDEMAHKLATRDEELRIANQHLEELASLDGLTGLANRRGFDREIERAWQHARESCQPVALMMVDIDHFKLYNDRYGHVAGDTCLRAVGETLSLVTLEEAVLVARYGGEEFALLLPGLDLNRAATLAEEARKSIEDLLITHVEAPRGLVTISIGVDALVPAKGQPAADLVEAADTALYAAKRRGRNTVVAHAPLLFSMAS
jgi:diguanylate cyclase (GGDEF)-like protein